MRVLLLVCVVLLLQYAGFLAVRRVLSRDPGRRARLLVGSFVSLALGAIALLWLPTQVPDTPGSPAALVAIALLWFVGGALLVVALPALVAGLWPARPRDGTGA